MAPHDDVNDAPAAVARENLNQSLELLWNGLPAQSRGPQRLLTLEQIAARAIEIADAEGLDALSMRRLGRELDVGTMSLYRYVPNKSVLIDLMLDFVSGQDAGVVGVHDRPWRDVLEDYAWAGRRRYLKHPWLLDVSSARPILGPGAVRSLDSFMGSLQRLVLSDRQKVMLLSLIEGFIVGTVGQEVLYEQAIEEIGGDDEVLWQTQYPYLEDAMVSGAFPTAAQMDEDSYSGGWEETFAFGLTLLLEGLVLEVERMTAT